MIRRVLTIGVYGFNERSFLSALKAARVDLFVDIRARRGVRGAEYAFANANRLSELLQGAGIAYVHAVELAPTDAMRAAQKKADAASGQRYRHRTRLAPQFVAAYERARLAGFSAPAFVEKYIGDARRPVLFCVEREPEACHRSLVAGTLSEALEIPVQHLMPPE